MSKLTLEQLEWRVRIAGSRFDRARVAYEAYLDDAFSRDYDQGMGWPTPEQVRLRAVMEDAWQALQAAWRERRAHPDWVPKKKKKKPR